MPIALQKLDIAKPLIFRGLSWLEFKTIEPILDQPGIRLSYLDGALEITEMPGRTHETIKKRIAALVEAYLDFLGIEYTPTGSMTLESEESQVKREADESYELGLDRDRPDLVIEIIITSGGISKLLAYQRLKISEVWLWEKGTLSIYRLTEDGYQLSEKSIGLPDLEIAMLVDCIKLTNHTDAVKRFRQALKLHSNY
jgi:Uma2 family endonuclease